MSYRGPQVRPVWMPDAQASACSKCFTFFKTLTRKHHCRQCGYIFCNECCATRTTLPHLSYDTPVRVCKCCFDINTCITQANDPQLDSQILSSQGFSLLTDDSTSQMRMMEQGCLEILIGCFNPNNIVSAKFLTKAFANLSQNATNRLRMVENSVIEAMAPLLPSEDSDLGDFEVCLFICNTFEGLACLENNQINTRLVGPHLDSIIRLVNSHDTAIRTSAAGILHNLIQNECTRDTIVEREGHNALISLVLVEEPSLQVTAAKALARLAEDEKYQRKVAQSGALMPLLMQLGSPSVEVQEYAAKALANLAENNENQAKICGAGGIRSLYSLLTSKDPGVLLNITKVLANLSSNRASHEGLSDVEVYSALIQIAICIIFKISHLYAVIERMRENKVLQDALRSLAQDPDSGKVHEHASQILNAIQASGGYRVSWRASSINSVSPGVHRTQSAFLPKTTDPRNSSRQSLREI